MRPTQQKQKWQTDNDDHHHQLEVVDIGNHCSLSCCFCIECGDPGGVGQTEGCHHVRESSQRVVGAQLFDKARVDDLSVLDQQCLDNGNADAAPNIARQA